MTDLSTEVAATRLVEPRIRGNRERHLRAVLAKLLVRWDQDAEIVEGSTHNAQGKRLPLIRRRIAAEAIRSCARELDDVLRMEARR